MQDVRSSSLGDTLVGAVPGLEVQVGGPVVGEVVGKLAGSAAGTRRNVTGGHGRVEGVAADDLVHVAGRDLSGVHERIQAIDHNLRASEPQHRGSTGTASAKLRSGLGEGRKPNERGPVHCASNSLVS